MPHVDGIEKYLNPPTCIVPCPQHQRRWGALGRDQDCGQLFKEEKGRVIGDIVHTVPRQQEGVQGSPYLCKTKAIKTIISSRVATRHKNFRHKNFTQSKKPGEHHNSGQRVGIGRPPPHLRMGNDTGIYATINPYLRIASNNGWKTWHASIQYPA